MFEIKSTPHPETDIAAVADVEAQPDSEPAEKALNPEQVRLFEEAVVDHYDDIVRYLRRKNYQDAEDLAQETFLRAFNNMDKFTDRGRGMRPWLQTIAHNTFISKIRHDNLIPFDSIDPNDPEQSRVLEKPSAPSVEAQVIAKDHQARLEDLIGELPTPFRQVANAQLVEGLDQKQIAETYGIPPATVRTRTRRARLQMEQLLTSGEAKKFGFDRPTEADLKGRRVKRGTHS